MSELEGCMRCGGKVGPYILYCDTCLDEPNGAPFKPPMPPAPAPARCPWCDRVRYGEEVDQSGDRDTAPQPPNPPGETAQAITAGLIEKRARYIRQLEEKIARQRVDLRKEKELREAAEKQRSLSLDVNAELRQRIATLEASNGNAFLEGAKWWEWQRSNATMFQSDQQAAAEEAKRREYDFRPSMETFLAGKLTEVADELDRTVKRERDGQRKVAALEGQLAEAQKIRSAEVTLRDEQIEMEKARVRQIDGENQGIRQQLAEAQAQLAMAVEALEYVSTRIRPCRAAWDNREVVGQGSTAEICVKVCFGDLRKVAEAGGIADNALTSTAPAVAEFVERLKTASANEMLDRIRGALQNWPNQGCDEVVGCAVDEIVAQELDRMAENLEDKARGGAGVLAYRIVASKCRFRAAELRGKQK